MTMSNGEPPKKAAKTGAAASASAAAGAPAPAQGQAASATAAPPPSAAAGAPGPLPIAELLTTALTQAGRQDCVLTWAAKTKAYVDVNLVTFLKERSSKVSFPVPSDVLCFPPLEIKTAASGAKLTSFREVMNHENLMVSFSQSSQYEAAGTVFMCDFVAEADLDPIRPWQLENGTMIWTESANLLL